MKQGFIKAYDTTLEQRYGDPVRMSEFISIHGQKKVLADQEYTIARAKKREQQGKRPEADQLETIFIDGVNIGGWLGDKLNDCDAYQALAQPTAKYDDFSHRLDVAVELIFQKPIRGYDGKMTLQRATIGIDTTIGGAPATIREKLTRHYSDQAQLPFGFSHLDYYACEQKREKRLMVPRYVIGLNVYEVRRIWGNLRTDDGNKVFQPNSPVNLQARFKVLAEIRAQNLLYFAMLPDDCVSKMTRRAALQIEAVDECLNAALKDCTKQIVRRQVLPQTIFAKRSGRQPTKREAIEEYLIAENRRLYRNVDPFTQIIGESHRLLGALYRAKDDSLKQKLEARRKIMAHNQAL